MLFSLVDTPSQDAFLTVDDAHDSARDVTKALMGVASRALKLVHRELSPRIAKASAAALFADAREQLAVAAADGTAKKKREAMMLYTLAELAELKFPGREAEFAMHIGAAPPSWAAQILDVGRRSLARARAPRWLRDFARAARASVASLGIDAAAEALYSMRNRKQWAQLARRHAVPVADVAAACVAAVRHGDSPLRAAMLRAREALLDAVFVHLGGFHVDALVEVTDRKSLAPPHPNLKRATTLHVARWMLRRGRGAVACLRLVAGFERMAPSPTTSITCHHGELFLSLACVVARCAREVARVAKVRRERPDGTYDITYDDMSQEERERVPTESMRPYALTAYDSEYTADARHVYIPPDGEVAKAAAAARAEAPYLGAGVSSVGDKTGRYRVGAKVEVTREGRIFSIKNQRLDGREGMLFQIAYSDEVERASKMESIDLASAREKWNVGTKVR